MTSDSEFTSGASDHDGSDTIVISSKSRILISPRKKGSKAVSRLLGSAAADEVVEQILRGTTGNHTEIVARARSATGRVGKTQLAQREIEQEHNTSHRTTTTRTTTTATSPAMRGNSTAATASSSRAVRSGRVVVTPRASEMADNADDYHDGGGGNSDLSSDQLSAPSSDGEEESEYDDEPPRRMQVHATTTDRTTRRTVQANTTSRRPDAKRDHLLDHLSESGASESDASSSTKGSSQSHVEMQTTRSKAVTQRKFDDQLRVASQNSESQSSTKTAKTTTVSDSASQSRPQSHRECTQRGTSRARTVRRPKVSDLDDSVILPSTATQEMEDLKQTLKKLAHQELPGVSSSSNGRYSTVTLSDPPKKSASNSGVVRGTDKLRREEYATRMSNDETEVAWSTTAALARFDESTSSHTQKTKGSRQFRHASGSGSGSRGGRGRRNGGSSSESDHSEPSVARRLFSTPPAKPTSTPPTVPLASSSFPSKRTPSPQSMSFHSSAGYTSGLDTSLTAAASSSAQGSRAVLSALKALQDKIRRLEEEREKLLQELSDVKVKARKREAEFASTEKQFTYELGQTKESARAAYDAIRSEKEELKLELVKYEERRKAMEAELQHARKLSSTYSAKADDLQAQLQMCESQRQSLHTEIDATRNAHKQEVRDLRTELSVLEKDRDTAQDQIKLLQQQFERESHNHAETRERLHETEQTIAGISQLNEKLVAKVWEANEIATKATKKSKKLQQSQRVSTLSRPTAASRAASISAANGAMTPGRPSSAATNVRHVASISAKRATTPSVKKGTRASSNLELLRAANLGNDIPFLLGTSANRSHSIISNVQEAIRQCDTTYAGPVTNPPPTPTFLKTKATKSSKSRRASAVASESKHRGASSSTTASILGLERCDPAKTLVGAQRYRDRDRDRDTQQAQATSHPADISPSSTRRPSAIRVPTPVTSYTNPMKSQIMDDLHAAVASADAEFTALNRKYKDMVKRVESGRDGAGRLSASLGPMLDELDAKGKQLNLLKQVYEQASHSTINPIRHVVHSPEAIQRKTASLRILNDYRQMERDAKSPRSRAGTQIVSPTGTNATAHSRRTSFFSDNE